MVQQLITSDERGFQEDQLLERLLQLYTEEGRIYREVLELSRRQGDVIRAGLSFQAMHQVLEHKQRYLDEIAQLESSEQPARNAWAADRDSWSSAARARLLTALQEVGSLIEEILLSEEANDRLLLEFTDKA